jgi:hypothetical protein
MVRRGFYWVLFLLGSFITSCKEKNFGISDEPVNTNDIDSGNIIDTSVTIIALPDPAIYKEGEEIKTG